MKNKESWQLLQEKEAQQKQISKNNKIGGENVKNALYQAKNMRYCYILLQSQVNEYREEMELYGIKPKNHITEQKEYIRRLEERNKKTKELKLQGNDQELFKLKRFRNVESYVKQVSLFLFTHGHFVQMRSGDYSYLERPAHCDRLHHERSVDRLHNHHRHHNYASQMQTDENVNLLNIKKPPTVRNRSLSNQRGYQEQEQYSTVNQEDIEKHKHDMINKNYSMKQLHQQQHDSHSIITKSEIPKNQRRLLGEEEKKQIISELVEKRRNLFQQLNKMPIANITKAHEDLKNQIESEIDEVENAIKMFTSKKPVYICDTNTFSY